MKKEFIVIFTIGLVVFGCFVYMLLDGEDRTEINECLTWKQEAKDYSQFWLTTWQDSQCRAHNIIINAPVK